MTIDVDTSAREYSSLTDEQVAHRIHDGDTDAETELVRRFSRGTFYLLKRYAGNEELAEDLHQETFKIVLTRLRSQPLDEPDKLGRFILRTAKNLLLNDQRKVSRRATINDPSTIENVPDENSNQLSQISDEEKAARIRQLLNELKSERDRQLLHRFYIEEQSKADICGALGLDETHFNRVLFRARRRFKRLLLKGYGQ